MATHGHKKARAAKSKTSRRAAHRDSARNKRRARCFARGEQRKATRRTAQDARAAANRARRAAGEPTPWEAAQTARALAREPLQKVH